MGLTPQRSAVVAPAATGILDPRTGKPVGADDEFFVGVNNELADVLRSQAFERETASFQRSRSD